jgi:hypothetical protein
MFRVVVNVSGRRVRIVPEAHKLMTAERDLGQLSVEDALANKDGLEDAVRGLLEEKGISNADTFAVEVPDDLRVDRNPAITKQVEETAAKADKGPVTKPENPKEGEPGSATNKPEDQELQKKTVKPAEEQSPPSEAVIKDGVTEEAAKQA